MFHAVPSVLHLLFSIYFSIFLVSGVTLTWRCKLFVSYHYNYEKHAPRVSQVIAAVAKVSCKHGLWLVARVNKTGNSMAVFLITTKLPVLFVLFYFYLYFFLFLFVPAVRKKYLQFICSNRFGIIVSLKPGGSHSPEIIF